MSSRPLLCTLDDDDVLAGFIADLKRAESCGGGLRKPFDDQSLAA